MPTLSDLVREHAALTPAGEEWLHLLVEDWQLISDLSFADLVLWVPLADRADGSADGYVVVAHCRPSTAPTVHHEDLVGRRLPVGADASLDATAAGRADGRKGASPADDAAVRRETIPVVRDGEVVAVLGRHTNLSEQRAPSRLEQCYLRCADALRVMVADGTFPTAGAPTGGRRGAPRVGDGMLHLDVEGRVLYASPNAVAAFHRIGLVGDLVGVTLAEAVADLLTTPGQVDESLPVVLTGRAPWRTEVEARRVSLSVRAVPLRVGGERTGALLLCRDVSELRRREQELLTKDATIREIHHRVKNNLQTVAALLRLQARRIDEPRARDALAEAMRRVTTIALVHETLSQRFDEWVDFDAVADRCLSLAVDVSGPERRAGSRREGSFGTVRAEDATPLALVLTELVTNAVEHGLRDRDGVVLVRARRADNRLVVTVEDDGAGLPEGFVPERSTGLGLQIVRSLVTGELRGSIVWGPGEGGTGTLVRVEAALRGGAPGGAEPSGDAAVG